MCASPDALAADYTFINVADTTKSAPSGTFDSFALNVSISGTTVAFQGSYSGGEGVFVGDGATLTTIAKTGDAAPVGMFRGFTGPAIDGETVAFSAGYNGGSGVFKTSGATLTTIARTGDVVPSTGLSFGSFYDINFSPPAISGGEVAFVGYYGTIPDEGPFRVYDTGVFRGNGGALTAIAKTGDPAPGGTFGGEGFRPVVSMSGNTAAFFGGYTDGTGAIFTGSGGKINRIAFQGQVTPAGVIGAFYDPPSISGASVAFHANIVNPPPLFDAILVGNGGPLTSVVKTGDAAPAIGTISQAVLPSFDGNTVAFVGIHDTPNAPSDYGIFVRSGDGPIEKVIATGESFFGSTLADLYLGPQSLDLSGSGNLAFRYELADGREGVALACIGCEPLPTPPYVINVDLDGEVLPGSLLSHQFTTTFDGLPVTWDNLVPTRPSVNAPTFTADGLFNWQTSKLDGPGLYHFDVTATNAVGSDTGRLTVRLALIPEPSALVLMWLGMYTSLGFSMRPRRTCPRMRSTGGVLVGRGNSVPMVSQ
jgi:hypothetical protein